MTAVGLCVHVFGPPINPNAILCSLQYYEMSYGLNIEMHKQVGTTMFLLFCEQREQSIFLLFFFASNSENVHVGRATRRPRTELNSAELNFTNGL